MVNTVYSTIRERCRAGEISVKEFVDFAQFKPAFRTHCLDVGDFVVRPSLFKKGVLEIEKIAELEYLGEHDFRTVNGTTGPISGNLFIKINKKGDNFIGGYTIIEGDRPYTGPGSVYQAVRQWRERLNPTLN
jgi:hypothetical protein